ncbi:MAG: ATP-dependent DNA helicase RecQ, partial [Candidatus Eisenbacteria bacterium]|nr:ATP-dependent DNA helicase RecQ [Candidatus Eisenbacteria bacterium]
LTFQIPARILPGAVLVISPLISLMKDQVDALIRLGFRATVLNSTVDFEERLRRLAMLRRGEIELLFVAPEGLDGSLRALITDCRVSLVVVDEAHCISHWGHDFRPAYRRLRGLKQEFGDIPVLALTATATRRVASDIIKELGMNRPDRFQGSFFRSNLRIVAQKKGARASGSRGSTGDHILGGIRRHAGESGIVYCLSRKSVEALAAWLRGEGVAAAPYHAGLSDQERIRHQDAFARDDIDVIVATVAFGMGIDKSNVRFVIHRDMPKSVEAWVQEIGRAGRDGLPSDCVLFYSWADVMGYESFLGGIGDPVLREETRRKTVELFRLIERGGCRHQAVVRHFEQTIGPCRESCDICRGEDLEAILGASRHGRKRTGGRTGLLRKAMDGTLETRRSQDGGGVSRAGGLRQEPRPAGSRAWPSAATPSGAGSASGAGRVSNGGGVSRTTSASGADVENAERFARLRAVRKRLADSEGVPAYIVFSDAVLRQMASLLPRSRAQMLAVPGVGPVKFERYGDAFLEALKEE